MRRALLGLCLLLLPWIAWAQDGAPAPVMHMELAETATIPGQPLSLRLTVLVPTFLTEPPVWPVFDSPDLLVRLPSRSTGPVSERIGGDTWAGVTRRYLISPMRAGSFAVPAQDLVVTWSDPDSGDKRQTTLRTDPFTLTGTIPEAAAGLDPFIAAQDLKLERRVEGDPAAMVPGDSVTVTLEARVEGVSPIFLPVLQPAPDLPGLAAYPAEPRVTETETRGVPGGTRREGLSLVAEGGGGGSLPAVTLEWFNLVSGKVETATVAAVSFDVDGPPARTGDPRDWRLIGLAVLAGAVALVLGLALARRLLPPLRRWRAARHAAHLASEGYAWAELGKVLRRRDLAALYPALDLWAGRVAGGDPRQDRAVQSALVALGASRYATPPGGQAGSAWAALSRALSHARRAAAGGGDRQAGLPPLNPAG